MKKKYFRIFEAMVVIIAAAYQTGAVAVSQICPENKYNETECLPVTIHNQSMIFVNPPNPRYPFPPYKPISDYSFKETSQKITVTPWSYTGATTSIDLLGQGVVTVLLDMSRQPYQGPILVQGEGDFTLENSTDKIYWTCEQPEELVVESQKSTTGQNFEIETTITFPLAEGACASDDLKHFTCPCNLTIKSI